MKVRHLVNLISVLLLVFVTLAAASPAFANAPVHEVFEIDYSYTCPANEYMNCWNPCNFDIQMHDYGTWRANVWTDEIGTHEVDIVGAMKRDWSANNKTVNIQGQGPVFYTYEYYPDRTEVYSKFAGANVIVSVPHYGRIWGGGGLEIETYSVTPDWSELIYYNLDKMVGNLIEGDWGPVCAYLGP